MPAERRSVTTNRSVKMERTHEENQERAYIAASRRSDRSIEARVESARRASEVHKKRTGRSLRVTEQDVINEEVYEEEDDDLPTQYRRLNAHLHTTSYMFNKKLHDYIATQHGVRNMFMSQFQNPPFLQYRDQTLRKNNAGLNQSKWLNLNMVPPQEISQPLPQGFDSRSQSTEPQSIQSSTYHTPRSQKSYQRAASMSVTTAVLPSMYQGSLTSQDRRKLSLPAWASNDDQSRLAFSCGSSFAARSPAALPDETATPLSGSRHRTPQLQADSETTSSILTPMDSSTVPQMLLRSNLLSMALPAESQQFVGSVLDPNDPCTAIFMSGSDHIAQPFAPSYTFDSNYPPNALKTVSNMTPNMPTAGIDSETNSDPCVPLTSELYADELSLTPGTEGCGDFFDFESTDFAQPSDERDKSEQLVDGSSFVN